MKFTLSWLKDHLETTASLSEIARKLVTLGLEVESIEDPAEKYKGFVVATVVESGRHPNADRLSLCFADAGNGERIQVVCGAPNVRIGMKVAFAPVGVTIPSTGTVLKKGKIRDIESFGMFCSATELGMGQEADGIMDLDSSLISGTPLAEALGLGDPIIDVGITPNRSDCFGIRGIARDLAASGIGTLKPLAYNAPKGTFPCPVAVSIDDSEGCHDFQFQVVKGVHNGPSPDWVQQRLIAIGLRPLSALVDITNYLTHDLGRPLHVFDLAKIKGNLIIRKAKAGETFVALNGKDYVLEESMTVIADDTGVLSLGGIIGGISTACLEDTVDVLIECAAFDAIRITNTGRSLSILSDARTRFERGVDIHSIRPGLDAATDLVLQWCGGTVSEGAVATHKKPQANAQPTPITLTKGKLTSLSGLDISMEEAKKHLEALDFTIVSSDATKLTAQAPTYRLDIEGPADLVEEVLRLKGYDHLPNTPIPILEMKNEPASIPSIVKRALAARGLNEAVTWSFMEEALALKFGGKDPSLRISNPISIELSYMRPSIIPNLIQAAIRNQDRAQGTVALFEVGPQYEPNNQRLVAAGLTAGSTGPRHWSQAPRPHDVFDAKAHALAVLNTLGVFEISLQTEATGPSYYHPGRKGSFKQGNRIVAQFGEIHPTIIADLAGDGAFAGFEVYLDQLPPLRIKKSAIQLSPYQPVTRDFAFVVDDAIAADKVVNAISKADRDLITAIHIFDVYKGDKLAANEKSLAIQVRLEPQSGTLTETQITEVCDKIVENVSKATGGVLRKS
jgi:phenylalanyl-tRNA synthetase beta chain